MAKKIIYQVVTFDRNNKMIAKVREFFSTKEKALQRIEKECEFIRKYGVEVREVKGHKWFSVEIGGEWLTCTNVRKFKTYLWDNYIGYVEYELD